MRLRPSFKLALLALFVFAPFPMLAQAVPAGESGNAASISVGAGFSYYSTDLGNIKMEGVTAWANWIPRFGPRITRGLGLEIEGRDIDFGKPAGSGNTRLDSGSGGLIYNFSSFHSFRPYVKALIGRGSIDFIDVGGPTHAACTVFTPGAGVEYPLFRHVSLRADYEYQYWENFLRAHALNPNGITVGASYHFGHTRSYPR